MFRPSTPSPVVIRFGRLGDTLLLQPLLQRLHRRYGRPCTLLASGDCAEPLYAAQPEVERIIALHDRHRPLLLSPQRLRAILALRRLRSSPFYICEPEPRALRKIRRMLRLAGIDPAHCAFLDDLPVMPDEHWLDRLGRFSERVPRAFAARFARRSAPLPLAPQLHVSATERSDCDRWLATRDLHGRPLVLLQPANKRTLRWNGARPASDDDKSWPITHWAALARTIVATDPQRRVLLCGAPSEAAYLQSIATLADHPAVVLAAHDLPLARLKATLAIAHGMISVDTGPAHLAAAVGCPLLVLFGAAAPAHWLPRSRGSAVLALGGPPQRSRVDAIGLPEVMAAWHRLDERPDADATTSRWQWRIGT